jgi:S-adenosylmethionine hydrolase
MGALTLARSAPYFPNGSIHVGVVDPGVGTARRAIAGQVGSQYFVGPDNGLFTPWIDAASQSGKPLEIVNLDQPE